MAKAVMMWTLSHSFDPSDASKILAFITFRFFDAESYLGALDATATIVSTDTPATIFAKLQNAVIAKAADYGITITGNDLILLNRDVPQSLMSANSTTITLTDDGLNQTITGGLGNLIFSGFSAGMQISSHLAVASASIDPGIALSADETYASGGYAIVGRAATSGGFAVTGVVGTGIANDPAVGDTFGVAGSTIIRGTGKTLGNSVGVVAQLVHIGTDATTVLNRWTGHRADAPSGDPMTLTDWVGFEASDPGAGTNRWSLLGANHAQISNPSGRTDTVLLLQQLNTGATGGAHMNWNDKAGDVASPAAGDFWRNGNALKFRDGASTTHALIKQSSAPTYTVTNPVTDRAYNTTSTTLTEVAQVLGTVIADLKLIGVFA